MDKDSQSKEKILEQGFETIIQNGVRYFTVESLAAHLSMSKKTIYKYFPSKDILIEKIFDYFTEVIKHKLKIIIESDMDPVEKYTAIMNFMISKVSKMSMGKLVEVQNRYPITWKKFEVFRQGLTQNFATIFIEAQEKGYARKDIDMNIVAIIYMNVVNSTFQPEFFFQNNLAPVDTIKLFMQMITEGIFIKPTVQKHNNKLIWES